MSSYIHAHSTLRDCVCVLLVSLSGRSDDMSFDVFFVSLQPPKKMTAAQKNLAKVDKSGMKTMSSFFSPKVKAEKK